MDILVLFAIMFGIMYFVVWRPQAQERRAHEELVASLAKDDRVVTSSGIHGRVAEVSNETLVLEISERARMTLDKTAVARRVELTDAKKAS